MEKALYLNGKKYISSSRAATLVGYTSDYVGQLARVGKIEATLVGRSWYISEDSILAHKDQNKTPVRRTKSGRKQSPTKTFPIVQELHEEIQDQKIKLISSQKIIVPLATYSDDRAELFPTLSRKTHFEPIKFSRITLSSFERNAFALVVLLLVVFSSAAAIGNKEKIGRVALSLRDASTRSLSSLESKITNSRAPRQLVANVFAGTRSFGDAVTRFFGPWSPKKSGPAPTTNNTTVVVNNYNSNSQALSGVSLSQSKSYIDASIDLKLAALRGEFLTSNFVDRTFLTRQIDAIVGRTSSNSTSGGSSSIDLSNLSASSPIVYNSGTGNFSFDFSTNNLWTGTNEFTNASATTLTLGSLTLLGQTGCLEADGSGNITGNGLNCGSGSGSGGGSWSTTTSLVISRSINYSNAVSDIIAIGSNSTTTAEFWFDPNTRTFLLNSASSTIIGNSTTTGALGAGALYVSGDYITDFTGSGLSVSSGVLAVSGLTTANFSSANVSQWTNDSGYLTSLVGAASSTLLSDSNFFSGVNRFNFSSTTYASFATASSTSLNTAFLTLSTTTSGTLKSNSSGVVYIDSAAATTASTTLLADSNSWSGVNRFGFASTTYGSFNTASTTNLIVNGQSFTNLLGSGLSNVGGALTVSGLTTSNFASPNVSQFTNDAGYLTSTFAFPFTVNSGYNSTSTVLGLNGFFSTASSTISSDLRLPSLTQGFTYIGSTGKVSTIASSSVQLSWFNNDAGFITSLAGAASSTLLGDSNTFSGTNNFTSRLGLATSTPFAKLSVNSIAGEAAFVVGSTTGTSFIVAASGNVGVGNSNPRTSLHIKTGTDSSTFDTTAAPGEGLIIESAPDGDLNTPAYFNMWAKDQATDGRSTYGVARMVAGWFSTAWNDTYYSIQTHGTNGGEWTDDLTVRGGRVGIATTSPAFVLDVYSATAPQLALSAGAGFAQWAFRNAGGNLYLSTTTVAGTATTTQAALSIDGATGGLSLGTTTAGTLKTTSAGLVYVDTAGGSGASTTLLADHNYFSGVNRFAFASTTYGSFDTASTTNFNLGGQSFVSLLGSGLSNVGGILTATGLQSYDAFTHPASGISATTSQFTASGLLSTASSTFSSSLYLPALSQGALYTGSGGLVGTFSTTTASCAGDASCTPFTVIGNSPVVISATAGASSVSGTGFDGMATVWNSTNTVTATSTLSLNNFIATSSTAVNAFPRISSTYASTTYGSFGTASTTALIVNGETVTDLTGSGLSVAGNALTVSGLSASNFTSANISQWTNDAGYTNYAFPFTVNSGYNSTSTVLGLNGFFSTASSTVSGDLRLPSLTQGFTYIGSTGKVSTIASSSVQLSWFNNDSGFITSLSGAASSTLLADHNSFSGVNRFALASTTYGSFGTASTTNLLINGESFSDLTGSGLALSGGALVTSNIPNASLQNSTISGIALGANLADLTATDSTLSFSGAYNGGTARNVGLNLGNANTWTAKQNFFGSASSTLLSANFAEFGSTATTTFTVDGKVGVGSTTPSARLSVNSVAGDAYSLYVGSTTAPWLRVSNSGFGTTTVSGLTVAGSATSTSNVGFNITNGCYAIGGNCLTQNGGTLTALGSGYATTTNTAIAFSTTTLTSNGQTFGITIVPSAGALTLTPTLSGTLNNTGLTNSSITINGTPVSLGASITVSSTTLLADHNYFSGVTRFNFASTTYGSFGTASTTNFSINGESFNDLTGSGLSLIGGALTNTGLLTYDAFTHPSAGISATTSLMQLYGGASTTLLSANWARIGGTASSTFTTDGKIGVSSSTPFARLGVEAQAGDIYPFAVGSTTKSLLSVSGLGFGTTTLAGLNISGQATSTSNVGFSITGGCYAMGTTCLTDNTASTTLLSDHNSFAGVNRFALASSTYHSFGIASTTNLLINGESFNDLTGSGLTLSGSTLALNTANANTWSVNQTFNYSSSTIYSSFVTASTTNLNTGFLTISTTTVGTLKTGSNGVVWIDTSSGTTASSTLLGDSNTFSGTNNFTARMGLATATPFAKLSVNSIAGEAAFVVGSSTRTDFIVNSVGNVGIGTTNPTVTLDVNHSGADTTIASFRALSNGSGGGILVAGQYAGSINLHSSNHAIIGSDTFGQLRAYTTGFITLESGGNENVRLTANGNLGISTTTPNYNLTIASTTGAQLALSSGAGLAQWTFRNAGGDLFLSTTTVAGTATTSISALEISGSGFGTTTLRGLNISGQATSTSNVGLNITGGCYAIGGTCLSTGGSGASSTLLGDFNTFSGTNNFAGSTGYSSSSPFARLSVNAGAGEAAFVVGSTTGTSFIVAASGNVGVGNSNPRTSLHIKTGTDSSTFDTTAAPGEGLIIESAPDGDLNTPAYFNMWAKDQATDGRSTYGVARMVAGWFSTAWNDTYYSIQTHGTNGGEWTDDLTVRGGRVGIATTSPAFVLDVYSATAPQLALSAGAGFAQWAFRNAGGNLYLSTTTVAGTATTTQAALSIDGATGGLSLGTTTAGTLKTTSAGLVYVDTAGGSGASTTLLSDLNTWSARQQFYGGASTTLLSANWAQFGSTGSTTIATNGYIGISTTTPFANLTIQTEANQANDIFNIASSSGASILRFVRDPDNQQYTLEFGDVDFDGIGQFAISGRTLESGADNVGASYYSIGQNTLVSGNTAVSGSHSFVTGNINLDSEAPYLGGNVESAGGISFEAGGVETDEGFANGASIGITGGRLDAEYEAGDVFIGAGSATGQAGTVDIVSGSGSKGGNITFYTGDSSAVDGDGGDILFDLGDLAGTGRSGRVGISTSSPYAKLSVTASVGDTNPVFVVADSSDAPFLTVASTGFGTTTLAGLDINGQATSTSNVGFNITGGCYAISGTCLSTGGSGASTTLLADHNYFSGVNRFALASTTYASFATASTTNLLINGESFNDLTGTGLALSGGALVTSNIPNASLANSTISGKALGTSLDALTATDGTLTFSGSYDGSTARTVGLNLANANTWSALQTFNYSSSTIYSSFITASSTNLRTGFLTLSTTTAGVLKSNSSGVVYVDSAAQTAASSTLLADHNYFSGVSRFNFASTTYGSFGTASTTNLLINGESFNDLTGSGLTISTNALTVDNVTAAMLNAEDFGDFTCNGTNCSLDASYALASRNLTAGAGMTGGGDLSADRTFNVVGDSTITVGADSLGINLGNANTWTAKQNFFSSASSTLLSANYAQFGSTATTTFTTNGKVGVASSTPFARLGVETQAGDIWGFAVGSTTKSLLSVSTEGFGTTTVAGLNIVAQATSTSNVGMNITTGCYAIGGTCLSTGGSGASTTLLSDFNTWSNTNNFTGSIGTGTTTPYGKISIWNTLTTSGTNAVAGIYSSTTLDLSVAAGSQFGNRYINNVTGTQAGSQIGTLIRMIDSSALANTVRGLEVQAFSGNNTLGINTGIAGFGKTFGLHGYTDGLAGAISLPAGVFAELGHATNGNAIRAYSSVATAATLFSIYQEDAAFTGTGLAMDIGNDTGSFASGNFIDLKNDGTTNWIVKSDGKTGIGTSSPWASLSVNGRVAMPALINDSTGYYVCLNTTTGQLATSTTACGASSGRFKENIENIAYGLNEILQLRPVAFDYKADYSPDAPRQLGFISEEVDGVIPELVARSSDGTIQGLDYPKFTAVLAKAMQELNGKVVSIESLMGSSTQGASMLQSQAGSFTFATAGAATLLAQVTDEEAVFTVTNATTTLATINGRGDLRIKGALVMENDSVAGSVETDGATGVAEVNFGYHLGTGKPVVELTTEGDVLASAQIANWKKDSAGNYIGFTIRTFGTQGQIVGSSVHYMVVAKQNGYQTASVILATPPIVEESGDDNGTTTATTTPPGSDTGTSTPPTDPEPEVTVENGGDTGTSTPPITQAD